MPPHPEDLYSLRLVGAPDLTRDARRIVVAVQSVAEDQRNYRSQLWTFDADSGESAPLTEDGPWSDTLPQLSPDANRVAFLSTRDGGKRAHLLTLGSGERTVLDGAASVTMLRWLDADRLIAVTESPSQEQDGTPVRIDWLRYKADGVTGFLTPLTQLHLLHLAGTSRPLPTPAGTITGIATHGARVAYALAPRHSDEAAPGAQVRILDLDSGEDRLCWQCPAPISALTFTAASGHLIAVTSAVPAQSAHPPRLWVVQPGGARHAFADADVECERAVVGDSRPLGNPTLLQPIAGTDDVAYLHTLEHDVALFAGDPSSATPPRRLTPPGRSVTDFSPGAPGVVAVCLESPTEPTELYLLDTDAASEATVSAPRRLSDFTSGWQGSAHAVAPQDVTLAATDGLDLHALLYRAGPGPRPLLVRIHGGPHLCFGHSFDLESQILVRAGYNVLLPNIRGSAGFGTAFRTLSVGDWGGGDAEDVDAFADWTINTAAAAETHMYLAGGSYGGYLVNWILGHTNRYRAAVSERSVSNLVSKYGTSDNGFTINRFEFAGLDIYGDDIHTLLDRSPLRHASAIRTPLLLIHGEADLRCPIEQSEQLFVALRRLHREAVLLRLPDESHAVSTSGRPDRRVARLHAIRDWLKAHP